MDWHHLSRAEGRSCCGHRFRPCARVRLPVARGAVRELVDALHGHPGGTARSPRCARGAMAAGMQIDVFSEIGFVMLIGLAAKNAILIVEFAKRLREEGH